MLSRRTTSISLALVLIVLATAGVTPFVALHAMTNESHHHANQDHHHANHHHHGHDAAPETGAAAFAGHDHPADHTHPVAAFDCAFGQRLASGPHTDFALVVAPSSQRLVALGDDRPWPASVNVHSLHRPPGSNPVLLI